MLNQFRKMGKRVFYITNNNVITRDDFLVKCEKLGFAALKVSPVTVVKSEYFSLACLCATLTYIEEQEYTYEGKVKSSQPSLRETLGKQPFCRELDKS